MIRYLVLTFTLSIHITWAQPVLKPPVSQPWQTLSGKRPNVIARGGLSGVFPDSSDSAFSMATSIGLKDTILFCDLQLTKDSIPFCLSDIKLDNTTNIAHVFPNGKRTYNVNGEYVTGWFALDFMAEDLFPNTLLIQNVYSRTDAFDNLYHITLLDELIMSKPVGLWLNVQYDRFYNLHQISPATIIKNHPNLTRIQCISSPEIGFLKSIKSKIDRTKTKLILKFLQPDELEPTTQKPYFVILKNLALIKGFASGILVPKEYIVPIGIDKYLRVPTGLVKVAHRLGIEVYAYGFANDLPASYNYSYDPTLEYLQFVDNSQFSVDGVLTDFPGTASEAIACIAHNKNAPKTHQGKALIISHNGASGDYAPCTDLAYDKAVKDGADIIDCSVQMSKDGVAFCSPAADLSVSTNALSVFMSQSTTIVEIQQQSGIFSFNLAWSQIQTLKPKMASVQQNLPRNPTANNKGKLVTLAEFLDFAKKKAVLGILIDIKNGEYLASEKSLNITYGVATALKIAAFDNQSTQKVFIQSDEKSVLTTFSNYPNYKKVYSVDANDIATIDVTQVKKVAGTIQLPKSALITLDAFFTSNDTKLVKTMHDANISVHVSVLYNEFTAILFDMFADPLVDLATFIEQLGVDGVVTDYPATARNYLRSPCIDAKAEYRIQTTPIGEMLSMAGPGAVPVPLNMTQPNA